MRVHPIPDVAGVCLHALMIEIGVQNFQTIFEMHVFH